MNRGHGPFSCNILAQQQRNTSVERPRIGSDGFTAGREKKFPLMRNRPDKYHTACDIEGRKNDHKARKATREIFQCVKRVKSIEVSWKIAARDFVLRAERSEGVFWGKCEPVFERKGVERGRWDACFAGKNFFSKRKGGSWRTE